MSYSEKVISVTMGFLKLDCCSIPEVANSVKNKFLMLGCCSIPEKETVGEGES